MSEILITQVPAAPIDIDVITGRVLTVTSPPEVYLPYIGANGHWWVGGIDSDIPARGEPGEKGSDGLPGANGQNGKDGADGTNGKDGARGEKGSDGQNADPAIVAEIQAAAKQAGTSAAAAANAAAAAEKKSENALAKAERAAQALADIPATIAGRAPCAKTGSFNFTRIYFPRAFVSTPDVVPGIQDFAGTWRVVAIVGLTPEYVDLTTNYWHAGNTFTYIAVGKLAD